MSAKVKPVPSSRGWMGRCEECRTASWVMSAAAADLWADTHNAEFHQEAAL